MSVLDLANRRALGLGLAVAFLVLGVGLAVVGLDPSDTEMGLIAGLSCLAALAVEARIIAQDK